MEQNIQWLQCKHGKHIEYEQGKYTRKHLDKLFFQGQEYFSKIIESW